jgi:hypothetical protein
MTKIKCICDNCPILNSDCDFGTSCNLHYTTKLIWIHKGDRTLTPVENNDIEDINDFTLVTASSDCKMEKIIGENLIMTLPPPLTKEILGL